MSELNQRDLPNWVSQDSMLGPLLFVLYIRGSQTFCRCRPFSLHPVACRGGEWGDGPGHPRQRGIQRV